MRIFLLLTLSFHSIAKIPELKYFQSLETQQEIRRNYQTNAKGDILEQMGFGLEPKNWFNLCHSNKQIQGVCVDKVYKNFGMPTREIVVAVIDSGVDVNHEDLQGRIWINKNEIPGNGRDDDGNGYIDDVFGWNFIGSSKKMARIIKDSSLANGYKLIKLEDDFHLKTDTLEETREVIRLRKERSKRKLSSDEQESLEFLESRVNREFKQANNQLNQVKKVKNEFLKNIDILKIQEIDNISVNSIKSIKGESLEIINAKEYIINLLELGYTKDRIKQEYEIALSKASHYNINSKERLKIVKDNPEDLSQKYYGNNDVIGPNSSHGTHVAGIIAANRDNEIGINGVASNVLIMPIKVVPDGDERDKDVINAIYYAVDNGAHIINMSFGKNYSPDKSKVDEAIKYAESKGVIFVHAAGNDFQNTDEERKFPNKYFENGEIAKNWLSVGASTFQKNRNLVASFSNFGKESVDLFAPGRNILSTFPNNNYSSISGTSMAAPVASGVLALALGFADESLHAEQLINLSLETTTKYPKLEVFKSGVGSIYFSELSKSGGIINAFNLVQSIKQDK